MREGHPPGVRRRRRRASRSTSPRAAWPPAPTRATRGRAPGCCRTSSSSTTACSTASRAEERANIGIHTCPGGDRDSVHSADVPYNDLLPSMFKMNAGYFLIQLASERDKDPVLESIGEHSRDDADGVAADVLHRRHQPAEPAGRERGGGLRRARPRGRTSSRRSGSARPTTAASRRSASTRSRTTARPTTPATSRSRRSPTASRARGWPPRSSASPEPESWTGPDRQAS